MTLIRKNGMTLMSLIITCPECGRKFDQWDASDAIEWANGHDCEAAEGDDDSAPSGAA